MGRDNAILPGVVASQRTLHSLGRQGDSHPLREVTVTFVTFFAPAESVRKRTNPASVFRTPEFRITGLW